MVLKPRHWMGLAILGASAVIVGVAAHASDPAARSVEYFSAHIGEADKIVSDCKTGAKFDHECGNAKAALDAAKARQPAVFSNSNKKIPSITDSGKTPDRRK